MPIYRYCCRHCDNQSISITRGIKEQEQIPICIKCGNRMSREYGLSAVTFTGSGFYSTDK